MFDIRTRLRSKLLSIVIKTTALNVCNDDDDDVDSIHVYCFVYFIGPVVFCWKMLGRYL